MDDHHNGPVEIGAPMDHMAHEQTYESFLAAAKWGAMTIAALLIAMAGGFFGGLGLIGGLVLFVILNIIGVFLLR